MGAPVSLLESLTGRRVTLPGHLVDAVTIVTCLIGKNEAGKTALPKALYRLNPVIESPSPFDVTEDYPRQAVSDYGDAVNAGSREAASVVRATYVLEPADIKAVEESYGPDCLRDDDPSVVLRKGYPNEMAFSGRAFRTRLPRRYLHAGQSVI